jgi:hypothetical protein
MCPTPDSTLADPHQISADLQRQLAECRAERDEALARETAMAEVLQVINSSPGDLAPVFDAILEKAHTLCGAAHGSLTRRVFVRQPRSPRGYRSRCAIAFNAMLSTAARPRFSAYSR